MDKKGFIKLSLLSLVFLAIMTVLILHVIPSVADVNAGDLGYGCGGSMCPAWVNISKGDMFFADDNQVFILVNYTCNSTSLCNENMTVTGDFSDIGGNQNVVGVFKQNATDYSWAIFELNDTINFSAYSGPSFEMTAEMIYLNATDGNTSNDDFNDEVEATVVLVNMTYPSGCPPPSEPLPPQIPLLNGTFVNIGACWPGNCTVEDRAQIMNATHYAVCGPSFGGDTTNFTALADTGNFSNFNFVIHILGKVKVNFTQNVSADPSICEFSMNTMVGPYFGINDTAWNGTIKPNLNLSSIITFYNVSKRFGFQGRPQIFRYPHAQTSGVLCPPSICSDFVWDGNDITFTVTGFSDYGVTDTINVTLQSPSNLSYVDTKNINFTFTPEWNSSVTLQNCTLYGNFTGTWGENETNQTPLVNGVVNGINNTVTNDGAYSWNVYCYNDSSQYDFYSINWTVIVDSTGPDWFTNTSSTPTNYSASTPSQFNVTWNDTSLDVDTILITIRNSTGVLINNASMLNDTYNGSIYNYSIVLPAGTFNWTSYANDTSGNWNSTDTWTFVISQATNPINLYFNGTQNANKTYTYPSAINATGTVVGGTVYIYRNGTYVVNGTSPQAENILLSNNTYPYKVNATGNANYTNNSTGLTYYVLVNKGTVNLSISANPSTSVTYPAATNVSGAESNIGDSDVTYELWRDVTRVDNTTPYEEVATLNAATYAYVFNSTGGENWTANPTGSTLTLTVAASGFIPTGGGGPIPIPTKITRTPGKVNISIPSISANRTLNITIQKTEDIAFRKLSINMVNAANNIRLTITKLARMPATISHGIEGKVYHYINIGLENINDDDINKTIIRLAVNKTWLSDNSINSSNISLYRWENTNWNELPTSYYYSDAFEYYYEAVSPGFSVFAIGESEGVPEVIEDTGCSESWSCTEWSECVNAIQARTCTDSNACGTIASKPAESQTCETIGAEVIVEELPTVTIVAVALLIVIVIVVLIFLRSKGRINFGSSKQDYY